MHFCCFLCARGVGWVKHHPQHVSVHLPVQEPAAGNTWAILTNMTGLFLAIEFVQQVSLATTPSRLPARRLKHQIPTPFSTPLLVRDLDPLPQPLDHELLAREAAVNVLDVIRGRLKVAAGVVALGDEDVVLCAVLDGLVQRDGGALSNGLVTVGWAGCGSEGGVGKLAMNCSSILPRRSRPGASSRWWFADVSAMVDTMAM